MVDTALGITVGLEFLLFLVLDFCFVIISFKIKPVLLLSLGIALAIIVIYLPDFYTSDPMMFSFGFLESFFAIICAIYVAVQELRG